MPYVRTTRFFEFVGTAQPAREKTKKIPVRGHTLGNTI